MNHLPAEIWGEIYSFACVDDGRTGRALSLVSRFTHETSKPYKLQSIAVIGGRQLAAFANLIEQTPTHPRRVDYIFISLNSYHVGLADHSALERVLRAISSSVRIIHAVFEWERPFVLLPVSLPVLEELVLHGSIHPPITADDSTQFTALKHLSFACHPTSLFENVFRRVPFLVNLRLSTLIREANEWSATANCVFPTHLQRIFIHAPTKPEPEFAASLSLYNRVMLAHRALADADHRVSLLRPLEPEFPRIFSTKRMVAIWSASVAGIPWW